MVEIAILFNIFGPLPCVLGGINAIFAGPRFSEIRTSCSVVARVVRKATSNLVLLGWLCLQSPVAMKLDFELDIARKVGCTVQWVGVHMTAGLDVPL